MLNLFLFIERIQLAHIAAISQNPLLPNFQLGPVNERH